VGAATDNRKTVLEVSLRNGWAAEREPSRQFDKRHIAIAASMQRRWRKYMYRLRKSAAGAPELKNSASAGGVAYNCVVNGKSGKPDRDIYINRRPRPDWLWAAP